MVEKYFSEEKLKTLKKELEYLRRVKSKEIARRLKKAAAFGDLSENAEYEEAREAYENLKRRIAELDNLIKNAKIIKKKKNVQEVQIGSKVVVKSGKETEEFYIVGAEEADPLANKISYESPIGKALLGKKVGEKVEVKTPSGKIIYQIEKIE